MLQFSGFRPRYSRSVATKGAGGRRLVGGRHGPSVAGRGCTSERWNAHKTEHGDEREVVYPWHPWAGCRVRVHGVIEKSSGPVLRASRPPHLDRWLELPVWMFDQASCRSMSMALSPSVDLPGLSALRALLASRLSGELNGRRSAHAPPLGAAKESCGRKSGGDADATTPRSRELSRSSPPIRPLRLGTGRQRSASVGHAPRGDAASGDKPNGTAHPRARAPSSTSASAGGDR